ncbi:MAG: transcriptional regulator, TetR family [Frankiales bacterium]|nr:transcriptional regulator, TetR family [Frankiales bacterium]
MEVSEPLSPREARRLQRIQVSREQILDNAELIFGEKGFHDAGLREIADACEFSVGSLYSFFPNKHELFQAVLMRRGDAEQQAMRELTQVDLPADRLLVAMAELQVLFFREHPGWSRIMLSFLAPGRSVTPPQGGLNEWYRLAYEKAMDIQAEIIARGQADGVIRRGNPQALARLFSSLVSSFHLMDPEISERPLDFEVGDFLDFVRSTFSVPVAVDR